MRFCSHWNRLIEQNLEMTITWVEGAKNSALQHFLKGALVNPAGGKIQFLNY